MLVWLEASSWAQIEGRVWVGGRGGETDWDRLE